MTSPYNPEFQFSDWPDGPLNANLPPDPLSPNAVVHEIEAEFGHIATAFTALDGGLREAINALLAGRLPTTPDLPVSVRTSSGLLSRAVLVDTTGGLVVVWDATSVDSFAQVFAARLDLARPDSGFSAVVPVTSGTSGAAVPTAVVLPTGELVVAYTIFVDGPSALVMKRATLAGLPAAAAQNVAPTVGSTVSRSHAVLAGDWVVFLSHQPSPSRWNYRRYNHAAATFADATPVTLRTVTTTIRAGHADASGSFVWTAFTDGFDLYGMRLNAADGTVDGPPASLGVGRPSQLFVLAVSDTNAMVFFGIGNSGLAVISMTPTGWGPQVVIPDTTVADSDPAAIQDADGTVYLFYARTRNASNTSIFLRRHTPGTDEWGPPQQVTWRTSDRQPRPVLVPGQGIWLVYASYRDGASDNDLYATRIVTAI